MIDADKTKQNVDLTQNSFRIILNSMANPGKSFILPDSIEQDDAPLFTLLATLLDNETTFSVIGRDVQESFIDKVYSLTKAEYASASCAEYVIISGSDSLGYLQNVSRGTLEFPDRGACVIYPVEDLNSSATLNHILLSGPGIKSTVRCELGCVEKKDIKLIKEINYDFPLGVDVIFIDKNGIIISIPRSSKITMED